MQKYFYNNALCFIGYTKRLCKSNFSEEKSILNKLHRLPAERISEVEDFVDFLSQRHGIKSESTLTQSAAAASAKAFQRVWDNPEDAVYDSLSYSGIELA